MEGAQSYLVQTMEFRRDGVAGIADGIPTSARERREPAPMRSRANMQAFLTSDVIYLQRAVVPR